MRFPFAAPLVVLVVWSVAACDDKASTADAGYAPTKTIAAPSVRTTRLDCGGKFGTCPPGENCYIDTPGCDATGFCGPPEPTCAHTTTFCGCHGIEFACTFPKHPWRDKGPQCLTEGAFNMDAPPDAAASASAAPIDASAPRRDGGK